MTKLGESDDSFAYGHYRTKLANLTAFPAQRAFFKVHCGYWQTYRIRCHNGRLKQYVAVRFFNVTIQYLGASPQDRRQTSRHRSFTRTAFSARNRYNHIEKSL
jgi:hypothetical protein